MKTILAVLVLCSLTATAGYAQARGGHAPTGGRGGEGRPSRAGERPGAGQQAPSGARQGKSEAKRGGRGGHEWRKLDTDGDGKLSKSEVPDLADDFDAIDTNDDGFISRDEMQAWQKAKHQK